MRLIWSIVALLVLAAAVALWQTQRSAPARPTGVTGGGPSPAVTPTPSLEGDQGPSPESLARDGTSDPDAGAAADEDPIAALEGADALVAELLASAAARRAGHGESGADAFDESEEDDDAVLLDLGMDAKLEGATVRRGRLVQLEDGTIRADRRHTIRGTGAARDPYRVTWELLMSASETYQPRLGEFEIPQRVAMLHGKHVRIEGYAAFPSASFDPREMLMMLNQWDGCCIGVPPTPFDAIEVQLTAAPAQRRAEVSYYGTVTGLFSVEPFLIDSWLVGMYLMDDASVNLGL